MMTANAIPVPSIPAAARSGLLRQEQPGMSLMRAGSTGHALFDLTLSPLPNEDIEDLSHRMKEALRDWNATPVSQFVFGSLASIKNGPQALERILGPCSWPVTWVDGAGAISKGIGGMQVLAVSDRTVSTIKHQNRVVGTVFEDGTTRHCFLGGLGGSNPSARPAEQTRRTFEEIERHLHSHGFEVADIVRTWFYLDDLLSWYGDFNQVRTSFYQPHRFHAGSLPASTGISAKNPDGTALAAAVWASKPINGAIFPAREVHSPMQGPAAAYGSAFCRAVEIDWSGLRRVVVSGTASIDLQGRTVWTGDPYHQIQVTMDVVRAILKTRGMDFDGTTRASLYFKEPDYLSAFSQWCDRHAWKIPPALPLHCGICRDDLLFEIELDAVGDAQWSKMATPLFTPS